MTQHLVDDDLRSRIGDAAEANVLAVTGKFSLDLATTQLRFTDGRTLSIPTATSLQNLEPAQHSDERAPEEVSSTSIVVPIIEERLEVGTREVTTGTVRIDQSSEEYSEQIDVPLALETYDVTRVPFGTPVTEPPPVRQDGDRTIYSVVEEQVLVTTQLILREEVHVVRNRSEVHEKRVITLHRSKVDVIRT